MFGAGVIGLELGQALHRLGVRVRLFGRDHFVGPLTGPDVKVYAQNTFESEFPVIWHADTEISREEDEVIVRWSEDGETREERFHYLSAATGRRPNLDKTGLENTSLPRDERGTTVFDPLSIRIGESHVFIAVDANVSLPILHEAADKGRIAGENATRFPHAYKRARRTPLGIVFSIPRSEWRANPMRNLLVRRQTFSPVKSAMKVKVAPVSRGSTKAFYVSMVNGKLDVYWARR